MSDIKESPAIDAEREEFPSENTMMGDLQPIRSKLYPGYQQFFDAGLLEAHRYLSARAALSSKQAVGEEVITWQNCPNHLRAELFPNAALPPHDKEVTK